MYNYKPECKYPYKVSMKTKNVKLLDEWYMKQNSLNLDISNTTDFLALQKALGNQGALLMLEELAKCKLNQKGEVEDQNVGQIVPIVPLDEQNDSMERQQWIKQFKKLSGKNNHEAQEAVTSGHFAAKHEKRNIPVLRASEFLMDFRGFLDMVTLMKVYMDVSEKKEIETEESDQLLKPKDIKIRKEFEMLLKMIKKLPEYTENETVQRDYYRVFRFLIATGIDLGGFFSKNGQLKEQRKIVIDTLED